MYHLSQKRRFIIYYDNHNMLFLFESCFLSAVILNDKTKRSILAFSAIAYRNKI